MRLAVLLFVLIIAARCGAQSYPDVDALLNLVFAEDGKTFIQYLPAELQHEVESLPRNEQAILEAKFKEVRRGMADQATFVRLENSDALLEMRRGNPDAPEIEQVKLVKRISDGNESLLTLAITQNSGNRYMPAQLFAVDMRLEEGQWRVVELRRIAEYDGINLEDAAVLSILRGGHYFTNEKSAIDTLHSYQNVVTSYAAYNTGAGYPTSLEGTGADKKCEPSNDGAVLCGFDPALLHPPYESSGYRFAYHRDLAADGADRFQITARPLEYGRTGRRSFFIDQDGMVRWTEEDRDPTADDPTLRFP